MLQLQRNDVWAKCISKTSRIKSTSFEVFGIVLAFRLSKVNIAAMCGSYGKQVFSEFFDFK